MCVGLCSHPPLIHFHLQKRVEGSGAKMQTRADNMGREEAAAEATEAGSVTQQEQAPLDEMERLMEENEDLKV